MCLPQSQGLTMAPQPYPQPSSSAWALLLSCNNFSFWSCSLWHPLHLSKLGGSCHEREAGWWLLLSLAQAATEGRGYFSLMGLPRPGVKPTHTQFSASSQVPAAIRGDWQQLNAQQLSTPHKSDQGNPSPSPSPSQASDRLAHISTLSWPGLWAATGYSQIPGMGGGTLGAGGRQLRGPCWPNVKDALERAGFPSAACPRHVCQVTERPCPTGNWFDARHHRQRHLHCLKPHPPILLRVCPHSRSAKEHKSVMPEMCLAHTRGKRDIWQSLPSRGKREWWDTSRSIKPRPQTCSSQCFFCH